MEVARSAERSRVALGKLDCSRAMSRPMARAIVTRRGSSSGEATPSSLALANSRLILGLCSCFAMRGTLPRQRWSNRPARSAKTPGNNPPSGDGRGSCEDSALTRTHRLEDGKVIVRGATGGVLIGGLISKLHGSQ